MVRWGSEFVAVRDVMIYFAFVVELVMNDDNNLRAEMRTLIAIGTGPILNFVYNFEGDEFLSPFLHE